ncbi:MAG TPA: bifunctional phosphopantothenoylcysteine decarboxylase/phosphopantothenate--cysteine ligase CoaBC [Candidatus Limnocylindrales bacterium]|jgi:phosphopantothenoylcysteine decarboxylase/phosphopantothenate--cysteine ligase|nr:bifunctional phosphopantothenoylcysteine decarboxylase/phosphopantothenate--cysteine ligase CoaBC [Candidatus Limnocylindrales bacterium]
MMKIALGVTGGIAAYKAAEIVRLLQDRGVQVQVIMTDAAQEFVRPLTFAALSGEKVITGLFSGDEAEPNLDSAVEHIAVAQLIDALLVAPATADALAKFAQGIANDFLSTLYLATKAPVIVAPAMNVNMWEHPATRANLEILRQRGVQIVEPDSGYLACGMTGAGRLAEPEHIVAATLERLGIAQDLAGETVLVTAGPTHEPVDPVRYIGNRSSGKMGYALAEAALRRGAHVVLVSGPTALIPPSAAETIFVETAQQMRTAVLDRWEKAGIIIMAAAVADYHVKNVSEQKIKRSGPIDLRLEPNPDILADLGSLRHATGKSTPLLIGFAAETTSLLENARAKLTRKRVDAIVLNDVSRPDIGFNSDRNQVTLVTAQDAIAIPEASKLDVAQTILDAAVRLRQQHATLVPSPVRSQ